MYVDRGQSTASAVNFVSEKFSKRYCEVHFPYMGHSFTGEVRMKGWETQVRSYSEGVRSERRGIWLEAGMLVT